ncbi:hypothetical protein [Tolypothrix sp. VBCCA 56010]|uniref:hypothetical protein n=1 Tax=Tolypothrix sp. VBCCA 56010 TaxID=3137731 RepID=UPI003D7EA20A
MKKHVDLRRSRRITVAEAKWLLVRIDDANEAIATRIREKLEAAVAEATAPLTAAEKKLAEFRAKNFRRALERGNVRPKRPAPRIIRFPGTTTTTEGGGK